MYPFESQSDSVKQALFREVVEAHDIRNTHLILGFHVQQPIVLDSDNVTRSGHPDFHLIFSTLDKDSRHVQMKVSPVMVVILFVNYLIWVQVYINFVLASGKILQRRLHDLSAYSLNHNVFLRAGDTSALEVWPRQFSSAV